MKSEKTKKIRLGQGLKSSEFWFLVLGMQDKCPDDVSGAAVDPIFSGHKLERKWARGFRTAS